MSDHNTRIDVDADKFERLIQAFGESPKIDNSSAVTERLCVCLRAKVPHTRWRRVYSGIVNYTEALCEDCQKEFRKHSRFVCVVCSRLHGFSEPTKHASGFVFEPSKHYHLTSCSHCRPDKYQAEVVELRSYCRAMGIPVREPDRDIVQEIEQKRLQGKAEIEKVMSSILSITGNEDRST